MFLNDCVALHAIGDADRVGRARVPADLDTPCRSRTHTRSNLRRWQYGIPKRSSAGTLGPPKGSVDPNKERASMPDKRLVEPVEVELGVIRSVNSARSAAQALLDVRWPRRGRHHRIAVETCLRILNGQRPLIDARFAFVAAAREAGILLDQAPAARDHNSAGRRKLLERRPAGASN
ncbi:DUF982 domain-containing protein [Mesorhizobium sp. 1B3]|uniref:DUF982 domain-containing protein n=1 Tax=Mesorhizobium sp. 1B3 TaxID=3243599 RepID=UPI003D955D96